MTLSSLHIAVLGLLRGGDVLTADELAERLDVPADDVVRVLRDLEAQGYIKPATAQ